MEPPLFRTSFVTFVPSVQNQVSGVSGPIEWTGTYRTVVLERPTGATFVGSEVHDPVLAETV